MPANLQRYVETQYRESKNKAIDISSYSQSGECCS